MPSKKVSFSVWLLASVLFGSGLYFLGLSSIAVGVTPLSESHIKNNNQPTEPKKSIFDRVQSVFQRQPAPPTTHGTFCFVTPNGKTRTTWSDRPIFVWQGHVTKIQLTPQDGQTTTWDHNLTPQESQNHWVEVPFSLEPGRYDYQLSYLSEGQTYTELTSPLTLTVLAPSSDRYQKLTNNLQQQVDPDLGQEEQSVTRAEIFAADNLWLDVWREVLSLEIPEVQQELQAYQERFCEN